MLPDLVSNPGPLTYESGSLPIALHGPAFSEKIRLDTSCDSSAGLRIHMKKSSLIFFER